MALVAMHERAPYDPQGTWASPEIQDQIKRDSRNYDRSLPKIEGVIFPAYDWPNIKPPPRRWLVENWIPGEPVVTVLSGDGGLGKSYLALQLAVSCVLREKWIGMPVTTDREAPLLNNAFVLLCEDSPAEAHRRLSGILNGMGRSMSELKGLTLVCRAGEVSDLVGGFPGNLQVTELYEQIRMQIGTTGQSLIVLDSLHNLYPGNENSRTDAAFFMTAVRKLAMEAMSPVVLIAHPSVGGRNSGTGEAGSTAWRNSARAMLYLTKPQDSTDADVRTLEHRKQNYARTDGKIELRWNEGWYEPKPEIGMFEQRGRNKAADQAFLSCLEEATARGVRVVNSVTSPNFAPKLFASFPQAKGLTKDDLRSAMERLFNDRQIVITDVTDAYRNTRPGLAKKPASTASGGVVSD